MYEAVFLTIIHLVAFVGFMWLVQYWSGWGILSDVYASARDFRPRQQWTFLSAWMGVREGDTLLSVEKPLFSLRSCLNIDVSEAGLRLSVFPLFRLFHPPLFIPWDHISTEIHHGIVSNWTELRFREAPSVVLRIRKSVGDDVAGYAPNGTVVVNERTP
jgi:hypothetical protein